MVEGSSKNIEVAVVEKDTGLRFLGDAEVDELVRGGPGGWCVCGGGGGRGWGVGCMCVYGYCVHMREGEPWAGRMSLHVKQVAQVASAAVQCRRSQPWPDCLQVAEIEAEKAAAQPQRPAAGTGQ